ncbi:MAG: hypothetical protein QXG35_00345 [Nitrososphaerota archaeon]
MMILIKAKTEDGFVQMALSPVRRDLVKIEVNGFWIICRIRDILGALESLNSYASRQPEPAKIKQPTKSTEHALKLGQELEVRPYRGRDGRILAKAPDGRVILFPEDSWPEEGTPTKVRIIKVKPTYYIAVPV